MRLVNIYAYWADLAKDLEKMRKDYNKLSIIIQYKTQEQVVLGYSANYFDWNIVHCFAWHGRQFKALQQNNAKLEYLLIDF
jgi:hypothetical protein